jgi:hypothetical protein
LLDDGILTIIIIILAVFPLLWQDLAKLDTIFNFINFCVKAWQGKSEFSKP